MEFSSIFFREILDKLDEGIYFVDRTRRITFWNQGAARIAGFQVHEVMGTRCCDNILMHVDKDGKNLCEGACPLLKAMNEGIAVEGMVFLHHKNGHRVPVEVRITPVRNDAGEIVGGVEIFNDKSKTNVSMDMIEDLRKQVFVDPLTGIPNRRYMETVILGRLNELSRYNWPFGLIFLDLDHFKSINDSLGHNAGDETLKMVSNSLLNCSRSFDTVGRWGGEEFVAVIVNVDEEGLFGIAERYRIIVEKSQLAIGTSQINITISIGATLARTGESLESLVERADSLMYRSKAAGRNCISMESASSDQPASPDDSFSLS
jgi:diguanylate cyclase (GGDEF)-like protein/PAS domain S-box-containing protein